MLKDDGFTLIELVVVIIILGILALAGIRSISKSSENAKYQSTLREMEGLKNAIVGDERLIEDGKRVSFGYVGDVGALPNSLQDLADGTGITNWQGPYVGQNFDDNPDDYLYDGWNELYTPDWNTTSITSNGGGNSFAIYLVSTHSRTDIENNDVTGIVMDREGNLPVAADVGNIHIVVTLPNGANKPVVNPGTDGMYTVPDVPIGIVTVTGTHDFVVDSKSDTFNTEVWVYPNVRVYPIAGGQKNVKFNQILPEW